MKIFDHTFLQFSATLLVASGLSMTTLAAATKSYQVTGPVLAIDDSSITVEKDKEKWVLGRDATTQVNGGDPKVGDKVTIGYKMVATTVEVKGTVTQTTETKSETKSKTKSKTVIKPPRK